MVSARDRIRRKTRRFVGIIALIASGVLLFVGEWCIEVLGDDTGGLLVGG
jgi:hypothetical protein